MKLTHMNRKDFIRTSSLLIAAEMLLPDMSCTTDKKTTIRNNWAGNYSYKAPNFYEPKSVEELQELVKKLGKQKALDLAIALMTSLTAHKVKSLRELSIK
jgi:xylitol oxidase